MTDESTEITGVLVVGGGDVGLVTALCLRQFNPDLDVTVVDDFQSDPPEVGKSTYEDITAILHEALEIPPLEFVSEVKPVWKGSVYFRDWCGREPFHFPFDLRAEFPDPLTPRFSERAYHYYDRKREDPDLRSVDEAMVEEGRSAVSLDPGKGRGMSSGFEHHTHAYHLDLNRFNSYLERLCEKRGITLVDDVVESADVEGDRVERVSGAETDYEADLYVDATGFNRVVKSELGDSFREFGLPLDSAFSAKFERPLSEAVPGTVIESGDYGWFWQIDTYEFRDVGYVYASEFVDDDDDAAAELAAHIEGAAYPSEMTAHEFTSGYYEHPFQGNCLTIGNAVGFIEPLQSTALTANAQAALKLSHLLSAHGGVMNEAMRETYNAWASRLWESIYDFIAVHYRFAPGNGEFWETMRSVPVSDRLETIIETYDRRGFDAGFAGFGIDPVANEELPGLEGFTPLSFYDIMYKMGVDSEFYEQNPSPPSADVLEDIEDHYESMAWDADGLLTVEEMYKGVLPEIEENMGSVRR